MLFFSFRFFCGLLPAVVRSNTIWRSEGAAILAWTLFTQFEDLFYETIMQFCLYLFRNTLTALTMLSFGLLYSD